MLTANNHSDIQILQGSDFVYELEFAATHNDVNFDDDDTSPYEYKAYVASDFTGTTTFTYGGSPETEVEFTVTKIDAYNITCTLPATETKKFPDDFEGVWDILEKKDLGEGQFEYVRQAQGDVVISPQVTQPGDFD